ncbi:MAG: type VII toxin-antitoxin system MntA family adenylyltransferase antitoxin [Bacillota bacterium]
MPRLSQKPSLIRLTDDQLGQMADYCRQRGDILALYLYGSYGTPYQSPLSDIDLAVLPMPMAEWDLHALLEVMAELVGIGRSDDVNVINLNKVPVRLQFQVLKTGHPLFVRDHILLADFMEIVIKRHADFAPDLQAIYHDFDLAVRSEFL